MVKPVPPSSGAIGRAARPSESWRRPIAAYATHAADSRGRLYDEAESRVRSPFQRDRDRVIHCSAFRRLKHKTQVFVYLEGDYYRTRLTHTLEVAQIARAISRALGLDEDLAEAIALAHDFGHTPFGHAGEEALDAAMAAYGGFDHNAQALRILTKLERRYAEFDGLNLTWETLEGLVKHNGPLSGPNATKTAALPVAIEEYLALQDLEIDSFAGPEAQVAAIADDIAYNTHDLDDGLRAGLFAIGDLEALPLVGPIIAALNDRYPDIDLTRLVHETVRRTIGALVEDVLAEAERRLAAAKPQRAVDIRRLDHQIIGFSDATSAVDRALKAFLFEHMYRHSHVNQMTANARAVVTGLFERLMAAPDLLPEEWRDIALAKDKGLNNNSALQARVIADYIAGMTDGYAFETHAKICHDL